MKRKKEVSIVVMEVQYFSSLKFTQGCEVWYNLRN